MLILSSCGRWIRTARIWNLGASRRPTLHTDDVSTRTRTERGEATAILRYTLLILWQGGVLPQPVCPLCCAFMHFAIRTRKGCHKRPSSSHIGRTDNFYTTFEAVLTSHGVALLFCGVHRFIILSDQSRLSFPVGGFPSRYILSLLTFVVSNRHLFLSNSAVRAIHTLHKNDLHLPSVSLSLVQKDIFVFWLQNL